MAAVPALNQRNRAHSAPDASLTRSCLPRLSRADNQLTGSLPDLTLPSSLRSLSFASNRLSGELPPVWAFPGTLRTLALQGNSFQGRLPAWKLPSLAQLNVSYNTLSGEQRAACMCALSSALLVPAKGRVQQPEPSRVHAHRGTPECVNATLPT